MKIEKLIEAVRLCGSTPKVDQCKQCAYWSSGDMSKCIPQMTTDAATALSTLQVENQALRNVANGFKVENEKLRAGLDQVEAEKAKAIETLSENLRVAYQCRDAAVEDLKSEVIGTTHACGYCKKNDPENFTCEHESFYGCYEWEWNGR